MMVLGAAILMGLILFLLMRKLFVYRNSLEMGEKSIVLALLMTSILVLWCGSAIVAFNYFELGKEDRLTFLATTTLIMGVSIFWRDIEGKNTGGDR